MPTPLRLWPTALLATGFYLWGASAANAQFITEGRLEAAYGSPLAVQHNATGFGDNTLGSQSLANGSELDAVYGRVVGSTLHLFLSGNLESNGNKLDIFFDTKLGGQNALLGTNPDVDANGLNAMAGLTFDPNFSADYYLSAGVSAGTSTAVVDAFYATLNNASNTGGAIASGPSSNQTLIFPGVTPHGEIGIDNSNILGVSGTDVGNPAAVATGIELLIPLEAIGSPTADFRVCVFINGGQHTFLSNQVLGTLPANTGNLGGPGGVRLNALSGGQSVLIPIAASPQARALAQLSAGAIDFGSVPTGTTATRTLTVGNVGDLTLNVAPISISNPQFATISTSLTVTGSGTGTLTITFTPTTAGAKVGTLTLTTNDPNQPTIEVALSGSGAGTGAPVIDGTLDPQYGAAVTLQTTPTGFGDNFSELDGAYVRTDADNLYILLTGNLENNGNPLELFFDTRTGGQNVLAATNPNVDNNALGAMAGLHFDTGFSPDYYLTVRGNGAGAAYTITAGFAPLTGAAGTGTALAGGAAGTSAVLNFSASELGQVAVNNTNTGGVTDAAIGTPGSVTTGVELQIPLSVLGSPTTSFTMAAMVNGGSHGFMSNQVLAGLPLGTANLGNPTAIDFNTFAGHQFFPVAIAPVATANIGITPDPLSIGSVAIGSTGTGTLTVTNSGTAALTITGITSSNGVFTVSPTTATVAAGSTAALTVTFTPTAVGAQTGTLTVSSNASGAPTTTVTVTATGTPAPAPVLSASATTLSLGSVVVGSTGTATFYVRNTGNAPLDLTGVTSSNAVFTAAPTTGTIAAGDSLLVTVTFTPTSLGAATGDLSLTSNGGTATVALTGTGIAPPAPVLSASATTLSLGSVVVGSTGTATFYVRNTGNAPLDLTGIVSSEAQFTVAPTTGTIAAGDSLLVTVTFTPTALGAATADLSLTSNGGTATVALTGTGVTPPTAVIGVSASTLSLGSVLIGSTGTATFYVRNTGTTDLSLTGIVSSEAQFTVAPTTGTIAAGDSLLVTVTFTPTVAGAAAGTLTLSSDGGTATVALTGTGIAPPLVAVDGSLDTSYPAPLAVQTTPTGFGNSTSGQIDVATGGSELDAAYGVVDNGMLYLLLTGNLESNGNKLELYFDTQTGGQNVLLNTNADVDGNGLNRQAGLTFDAGFAPDYYLTLNNTNTAAFGMSASFAPVNGAGGLGTLLSAGASRTQTLAFGTGLTGTLSLNNSNIGGVDGSTVGSPESVTTGVELAIPLAAIGNPTGPIRITAFINGAQHDFVSNQVLAGLPNGTANLGNPATASFAAAAGNQFFVVPNGVAQPAINLSTTTVAIGNVTVGATGTGTFTVRNPGTAPLTITGITSSTGTFTVAPTTGTVAPGDSLLITVTFSPTALGAETSTLTIASDAVGPPTPTVAVTGTGVAAPQAVLTVSTTSLNLGSVGVGGSTTATFVISNTGNAPLSLTGLTSTNAVFTAAPLTGTIAAGDSLTVTITFTPTAGGPQTATLTVASSAGSATVALSGNGVVGLAQELAAAHLHVYPNPATAATGLTVEWTGSLAAAPTTAVLLDGLGRTVRSAPVGTGTFPLTNLSAGVYTLRLTSPAGPMTRRVVVE